MLGESGRIAPGDARREERLAGRAVRPLDEDHTRGERLEPVGPDDDRELEPRDRVGRDGAHTEPGRRALLDGGRRRANLEHGAAPLAGGDDVPGERERPGERDLAPGSADPPLEGVARELAATARRLREERDRSERVHDRRVEGGGAEVHSEGARDARGADRAPARALVLDLDDDGVKEAGVARELEPLREVLGRLGGREYRDDAGGKGARAGSRAPREVVAEDATVVAREPDRPRRVERADELGERGEAGAHARRSARSLPEEAARDRPADDARPAAEARHGLSPLVLEVLPETLVLERVRGRRLGDVGLDEDGEPRLLDRVEPGVGALAPGGERRRSEEVRALDRVLRLERGVEEREEEGRSAHEELAVPDLDLAVHEGSPALDPAGDGDGYLGHGPRPLGPGEHDRR